MQRFFIIIERTNVLIWLANPDRMWYSYIEHIFGIKGRQWRTDMELAERGMELKEKLRILADAAKYDVACTSSGVDRRGKKGDLGNSTAEGICHSFAADGRCISLLKILLTNHCIYDCKYCINRRSNDVERAAFAPEEICRLTMEFYRRNYIEGLFLSSGVQRSPNDTMEQMYQVLYRLRNQYRFRGYIHVKAIPGADEVLLDAVGRLADRMSINLELPTAESLHKLAPHKSRSTILTPMKRIRDGIMEARLSQGKSPLLERAYGTDRFAAGIFKNRERLFERSDSVNNTGGSEIMPGTAGSGENGVLSGNPGKPLPVFGGGWEANGAFAPAGQSTQIIVGATPETDYHMLRTAQALYRNYDLKRVFYSAYVGINEDPLLPDPGEKPPLLREHRLYQADWLLRFYGFRAEELLTEERPNFHVFLDPKCDWAVRHLEHFPVEIMRADYETLLRVPGIGVKSARRILTARRMGSLDFPDLKRLGVVLKRAHYFILCGGKQMFPLKLEENRITKGLISDSRKKNWELEHRESFRQMNLFDDMHLTVSPLFEDIQKAAWGEI